jgi:hypothetical protein
LGSSGVEPPPEWNRDGLATTLAKVQAVGLPDHQRRQAEDRLSALGLALSAEALIAKLIDPVCLRAEALASAYRAARRQPEDVLFKYQFDLIFEAARARVGDRGAGGPAGALVRFVARLDHEAHGTDVHRKELLAWGQEHGLEDWLINRNIEQACARHDSLRLVIDLRNPRDVAEDNFPRQAEAKLFRGVTAVGEPLTEVIGTPDAAGVCAAVSALFSRFGGSIGAVHFLMPDRLLLLDAQEVRVKVNARFTTELGRDHIVSVHCDRTDDIRLEDFPRYYEDVVGGDFPTTYVDFWPPSGRFAELPDKPEALVFRIGVDSEAAPEALLDAIYMSPIVVWPSVDPDDREHFAAALAHEWPNLPAAARAARWGGGGEAERDLHHVRFVWDDPEWIKLLRGNYARD